LIHPAGRPSSPKWSGKSGEVVGQAGGAAFGLGVDGAEVDEPATEQRPRHRLQRLRDPPVQLDLVVERAEKSRYSALGGKGGIRSGVFRRIDKFVCGTPV
jgi:hypothetical protein